MATLILSTVGTALGGPVGAAIGALIGQSIDQQILGPATRGPRLGDLSVQTSSYGTQVPRVYGRMRVAGSVIWATDLVQGTQTTGAKGQPDTTFSYSVSFAVALSSRPIVSVGRIWADGKLIRGADGVFTTATIFRLHDGSEGQNVDPLIASVEGIGNAPAYRGLALAVFEDLELANYGNRIPFLTFEVVADESDPPLDLILGDATGGAITASAAETVIGYAAYGQSMKSAVAPIIATFGLQLFDDGMQVRGPASVAPTVIADQDLGNSADGEQASRMRREQSPVAAVPAALRLAFYDPARDYQSGEARASAGEQGGPEHSTELPAVVDAANAKAIVNVSLARSWLQRDKLTLRLPPRFLALEPGARLNVPLSPAEWTVETCTIEGFVAAVELRPAASPVIALAAQGGRILANAAVAQGPVTLAMFDSPDLLGQAQDRPMVMLAASAPTRGWRPPLVAVEAGGVTIDCRAPPRKSILGQSVGILPQGDSYLIDGNTDVEVVLIDHDQWLTSCDDEALSNGANLAMLGSELLQFGSATPTGTGRFRLARLLRGRGGTEWAIGTHQAGEPFVLIVADGLTRVNLPSSAVGASVSATPAGGGTAVSSAVSGEALRPPAPVALDATLDGTGTLTLRWIRRSRHGWTWRDEVDVPLGEATELYRVQVVGAGGIVSATCATPEFSLAPSALVAAGTGTALVEVRQLGDFAASRPVSTTIILP